MNIKIIVAAHKAYDMPADHNIYLPLHVGAEGKKAADGSELDLGFVKDNTGDHISEKNPAFCELTGLYWAWKNLECDYLGLVHYRRHFTVKSRRYQKQHTPMECVMTGEELARFLPQYKIIVPQKRRYYIESLYSHYAHTHYAEHLDITREIIREKYPEYLDVFDLVMKQTWGYMFNMYVMEKSLSDSYCAWLFDILFELEKRAGEREYSAFQGRFYGRVSEILFNVWLKKQGVPVREIPCMHMEEINWWKKGTAFLRAKFGKRKYEGSF